MEKPVSTTLYDIFYFVVRSCCFIAIGNPLSMLIFNLIIPCYAAKFARNRHIFGEEIYTFYKDHALKWYFPWAKWWINLDNLHECTPDQQVQYLFDVAFPHETEVDTLKAMRRSQAWPAAYQLLFFTHGTVTLPLKKRDIENRTVPPSWNNYSIAEFMMQNRVRLSYDAFKKTLEWANDRFGMRLSLEKYLENIGKLDDQQFDLLVEGVLNVESVTDRMLKILQDYIMRFGISNQKLDNIIQKYPSYAYQIAYAATYNRQMRVLKKTRNKPNDWREFCKKEKRILPGVQNGMNDKQQRIYNELHTPA